MLNMFIESMNICIIISVTKQFLGCCNAGLHMNQVATEIEPINSIHNTPLVYTKLFNKSIVSFVVTYMLIKACDLFVQCPVHLSGLVKDATKTLRELNVANGVKMMVVGSTITDVMKVTPPPPGALKEEKTVSG